ncbi:nucleophile aminohydrolase [Lanmaoa asiatica]|nr:nucleophile aminohydrolase [Lanmaoa asiatica]
MCRFVIYKGTSPVQLSHLLTRPCHSIINQAFDSRLRLDRRRPINGDGFGVGWYDTVHDEELGSQPCIFTSVTPAWNNANLIRLAEKIKSPLVFAHVRATTAGTLSLDNCHPFVFGNIMFMHNGGIADFHLVKRRLQAELSDEIFNVVQGNTDVAPICFQLPDAKAKSFTHQTLQRAMLDTIATLNNHADLAGIIEPSLMNFCVTDGESVVATRYISSRHDEAASLWFSSGTTFSEYKQGGHYKMTKADKRENIIMIASEPLTFEKADWMEIRTNNMVVITPKMNFLQIPIVDKFYVSPSDPAALNRGTDFAAAKGLLSPRNTLTPTHLRDTAPQFSPEAGDTPVASDERIGEYEYLDTMECTVSHGEVRACPACILVNLTCPRLSTVLQILLYLPLTLATLSTPAFLLLSLLLSVHSFIHGTLILLWGSQLLSVMQVPMHPFLFLVSFNAFSQSVHPALAIAASWWGKILTFSGPAYVAMEGLSSLLFAQKVGQVGKELADEAESYQFGILIASAAAYVIAAWWIVVAYPAAATSPLSSTLLGVALTAFLFLTVIGFRLRRTNIVESSMLSLFLAYNIWLCGFDQTSFSDPGSSYAPLLSNILPHLQTFLNVITNTLPKPVLVALFYRLTILQFASRILPTIGADAWESDDSTNDGWNGRPVRPQKPSSYAQLTVGNTLQTSTLTRFLLTYRQLIFVLVYSHLLLLDPASQVWWRWANVMFTLLLWSVELIVSPDGDDVSTKWKVE